MKIAEKSMQLVKVVERQLNSHNTSYSYTEFYFGIISTGYIGYIDP